jgi:hypothetical protein
VKQQEIVNSEPRFERKFLVPKHQSAFLSDWLDHVCVPDPRFPCNVVNSLYYDTARLDLCMSKESSDFLKAKVRVRWYDDLHHPGPPIFLEAKMKEGAQVHKARVRLDHDGEELAQIPADDQALRELQARVAVLVPFPIDLLLPVCVVSYRRKRYVDPVTGWRVSLDEDICLPAANTEGFPLTDHAHFDCAVLELKGSGPRPTLPSHLTPHVDVTVLPETFSKYHAGVESLQLTGVPL